MRREPVIGVLVLATGFERPVGDIGNPASFEVPTLYETIRDATPERVVRGDPAALLPFFIGGAERLLERGATIVSTSCGFLAPFQEALARAVPVPVVASALSHCAACERPAILTIEQSALTPDRLRLCGVDPEVPVRGMDGSRFATAIMGTAPLDPTDAQAEHIERALSLVKDYPRTSDIVLECTNMGPYRAAIEAATARPVHSIVSLLASHPASQRD